MEILPNNLYCGDCVELLKELKDDSAAKEFCEHNIKKAIKWLGKINGNGNPEITK